MSDSDTPQQETVDQSSKPPEAPVLYRCPECGIVGLPERLAIHSCTETAPTTEYAGDQNR